MPASAASGADSAAQTSGSSPARRAPSATASVPGDRTHSAVERELADRGVLGQPLGRELARRREHGERDRQVEPRALLAERAGARLTVIRRLSGHSSDAETTPLRTRCFASWQARSASPTIAKPGTARLDVRLDLDPARLEADERMGDRAREHPADGRRGGVTVGSRLRNKRATSARACNRARAP